MSPVTPHPSTAIAHRILDHYLAEWSEVVARDLRSARPAEEGEEPAAVRAVYVDGFCHSGGRHLLVGPGRVAGETGSALRGVQALDRLAARAPGTRVPLHTATVLVEEDPAALERLLGDLERIGVAERVRRTGDLAALAPGEIAVVHAEFREVADWVADLVAEATHALCFLAPPAAGKLPLPVVRSLAAAEGADLLLSFPHADLQKQARYRGSTLADLPTHARQTVDGYSAMLGDARYEWLQQWRQAEREGGVREAERRVVERYVARLEQVGEVVKPVTLHLSDEPADTLHLVLMTADPARALALNRALRDTGVEEKAERDDSFRLKAEEAEPKEAEVLELFAPEATAAPPSASGVADVDADRLARTLAERFRGRTVPYRDVLLGLIATDLTPEEVRRAMAALKRTGEAVYRSLADPEAEVAFPRDPVAPTRKKRAPRAREGEITLLSGLEGAE
ncbi:MAG: three-Cys-motif partner protein TcmP [Gemmatimonadetes bacterium]|nr:three-Cys-motif partner protein TcmP [Gemmatimonadota bacterium]